VKYKHKCKASLPRHISDRHLLLLGVGHVGGRVPCTNICFPQRLWSLWELQISSDYCKFILTEELTSHFVTIGIRRLPKLLQTCLKRNLVITETCLERKIVTVPGIQISSTCIKQNLPAVEKIPCLAVSF